MKEGYKMSLFGEIPESWEVVNVKDITKEHKQGFYTKEEYTSSGVRLVRVTDLKNPYVDYSEMPFLNISEKDYLGFRIELNDFLFARSGAIGRYGIVEQEIAPAIFGSYLIRFKFTECMINRFFGYFYESELCKSQLNAIAQGNANININAENIKSLRLPFPPLSEQQKIADILSTVDEKIESIDQRITQTQELKKGLMQRLLTKGIGHTKFKDSPLGEIPESWEVRELNEITNITRLAGYEYSEYWKESVDGEIMALRGYNIGKNRIIYKDLSRISNKLSQKLNRSRLYKGDIAFPCVGTIGNAVVIEEDHKFHINQNIAKITSLQEIDPNYLVQYLISSLCRKEINRFNATTSQPNVLVGSLRKCRLPIPLSILEQKKIADILSTVDEKLEVLQDKKQEYQELKKGLMQQLLTGKIRVQA